MDRKTSSDERKCKHCSKVLRASSEEWCGGLDCCTMCLAVHYTACTLCKVYALNETVTPPYVARYASRTVHFCGKECEEDYFKTVAPDSVISEDDSDESGLESDADETIKPILCAICECPCSSQELQPRSGLNLCHRCVTLPTKPEDCPRCYRVRQMFGDYGVANKTCLLHQLETVMHSDSLRKRKRSGSIDLSPKKPKCSEDS